MKRNGAFWTVKNDTFERFALELFRYQATNNVVYGDFIKHLKIDPNKVNSLKTIPFLPIQFFKTHKVVSSESPVQICFTSSGTSGVNTSKHLVTELDLYKQSFLRGFDHFYGPVSSYTILGLLPSYLERDGSSLIFMVDELIRQSESPDSGFYLHNLDDLHARLLDLEARNENVLLIGVSYALLDLIEKYQYNLKNTIIMETGGMKGRREEMIKAELHEKLCTGFGVTAIHSEYGMTELLSQAYSKGSGLFDCPPWMKVLMRDTEDAMAILPPGSSGGINVIDLANENSCSFIATQDLGKVYEDGTFEVLGRFDHSDIRGCNLLVI